MNGQRTGLSKSVKVPGLGEVIFPSDFSDDTIDKAQSAYGAYLEWKNQTKLRPYESEMSLVCECHQLGGTLDTSLVHNRLHLGDIKTSNAIYPEMVCQLAAYKHLYEINTGKKVDGCYILRFSKVGGAFSQHFWPDVTPAWEAFELMRRLYDYDKILKEMV